MARYSAVRLSAMAFVASMSLAACAEIAAAPVPFSRSAEIDIELHDSHSNAAQANRLFQAGTKAFRQELYDRAMHFWHEAALLGHARAQFNVGSGYASGTGLPKDLRSAAFWWRQAARHGNIDALYNLGVMNYEGRGMDRDLIRAKYWWRQAATQGDPASMFRLGMLAAAGEGEISDLGEARFWWERSANLGFSPAIKALEILDRAVDTGPVSATR